MTRVWMGVALVIVAAGCASAPPRRDGCVDVERRLNDVVSAFDLAQRADVDAMAQMAPRLERLSLECPAHAPTTLALAAVVAEQDPARAQTLLDRLLSVPGRNPDAAVMRAQLSINEGNLGFARRLLAEQIRIAPDHAGVREAYAATLFLAGQLDQARDALQQARALGAAPWRIAYHLGLVEEAAGRLSEAERAYQEALTLNPSSADAAARLKGVKARVPGPSPAPSGARQKRTVAASLAASF